MSRVASANTKIVGADDAEPQNGRIAFSSPRARARVLGARAGNDVTFESPGRVQELSVVSVD